jgi:hypothetical protein
VDPVLTDDEAAELRRAVDARLEERIETARRRRERLAVLSAAKKARREVGLKARHTRKLNRIDKEN